MKLPSSSKLASLAEELIDNPRGKANNLPTLISALNSTQHQVLPIIQSLKLYFVGCFEREELTTARAAQTNTPSSELPEDVYSTWLQRQYAACIQALLTLLASGTDGRLQVAALSLLMECLRGENLGTFNNELFSRVVYVMTTHQGVSPEALGSLLRKYAEHADVRYHLLRALTKICGVYASQGITTGSKDNVDNSDEEEQEEKGEPVKAKLSQYGTKLSPHDLSRTLYDILSQLPDLPEGIDEVEDLPSWCGAAEFGIVAAAEDAVGSRQRKKRRLEHQNQDTKKGGKKGSFTSQQHQQQKAKWASVRLQNRAVSDAWLAFLRLDFPDDVYKKVLSTLHTDIIPKLFNPLLLSDFLTYSLDKGGLIGMLALNGIFILVTRHGLEYPKFYEKLYNLLTPDAFQAKYRVQFFQLADIFLASGLVPAYTGAAFAKRFARLALTAPPGGALVCIAFIHNIIRRHPACIQLLHRAPPKPGKLLLDDTKTNPSTDDQKSSDLLVFKGHDVYDPEVLDPAESRALESSLWEITALRQHANPLVANYCSILEKDLTDRRKTTEVDVSELLGSSYTSLFTQEVEKRLKQVPTAFYAQLPTTLFEANDPDFPGWKV